MPPVYYASDIVDAHLARQFLEQNGIPAHVTGDMLSQAGGELPLGLSTAPAVWVSDEDADAAREMLNRFEDERESLDLQPDWICPNCANENPGHFDSCWSCEQERPPAAEEPAT